MSRRTLLGGILLSLAAAVPLEAQLSEAELLRLIDSLAPLVERSATEADAARRARFEEAQARVARRVGLDTLSIEGMTVITPDDDSGQARELFTEVWNESFRGFTSRTLAGRTFTFQRASYDVVEIPVDGRGEQIVSPPWHSRQLAKARIRAAIGRGIAAELEGSAVGAWMTGNPFSRIDSAGVYRQMVVAGSVAVRRCLDGDVASCSASLGLGERSPEIAELYTPEQRRDRIVEWAGYDPVRRSFANTLRWTGVAGRQLERCADLVAPDACDAFIARAGGALAPLPPYIRDSVVALALETGGPSAWDRLLEDPGMSAEEALSHAAGMPLDDLLADWREWVLSNRPETHADLGRSGALSVLWILLFAAFAARSTRWRFD